MKKLKVLLFVLTLMSMGAQRISAQTTLEKFKQKLTMGIKVQGSGTTFLIKDNPLLKGKMGAGGALGNFIRFNVSEHFAIQEDIMFVYYTAGLERNGVEDTFQYFGSEVPIYLMGQWKNEEGNRFFFGAGPYFGIGFSGKYKNEDVSVFKKYNGEKAEMTRLAHGAAANFGYEFSCGLQINATYKYGFNALEREKDNYKMSPQTFSVGVGYNF